jgi:hypothetical protein
MASSAPGDPPLPGLPDSVSEGIDRSGTSMPVRRFYHGQGSLFSEALSFFAATAAPSETFSRNSTARETFSPQNRTNQNLTQDFCAAQLQGPLHLNIGLRRSVQSTPKRTALQSGLLAYYPK